VGVLLRAAAVSELTLGKLLGAERGGGFRLSTEPPGDPFRAEVWR
jgi:hypothetical protein